MRTPCLAAAVIDGELQGPETLQPDGQQEQEQVEGAQESGHPTRIGLRD